MSNCLDCRYCRQADGGYICDKIAERLLSTKGCGHYVRRSPFDAPKCPNCGRTVIDKSQAIHECIPKEV